jgi:protease I
MKHKTILIAILTVTPTICTAQITAGLTVNQNITLPNPAQHGPISLEQVMASRRPTTEFTREVLDLNQIGQLLWAGQGITDPQTGLRTAPSIQRIYPIELRLATSQGTFSYNPNDHSLQVTSVRDVRKRLATAANNRQIVADAQCVITIAGSGRQLAMEYGARSRRLLFLEAGQTAQNIHLQAVSLGLATVTIEAFDGRTVNRAMQLPRDAEPLVMICTGYPVKQTTLEQAANERPKRAALIIPSEKFRDEELFETLAQLDSAQIQAVIASSRTGIIRGMLGSRTEAIILLAGLNINDFDAIIFIGGLGAREYFLNPAAWDLARLAMNDNKIVAAISNAPTILANAGLLDGRRVTAFPTERTVLLDAGARYTGNAVEKDGLLITASGPMTARQFGQAIVEAIERNSGL